MSFVEDLKEKAMSGPAAESVLDIADWFFKKAETVLFIDLLCAMDHGKPQRNV